MNYKHHPGPEDTPPPVYPCWRSVRTPYCTAIRTARELFWHSGAAYRQYPSGDKDFQPGFYCDECTAATQHAPGISLHDYLSEAPRISLGHKVLLVAAAGCVIWFLFFLFGG